MKTLLLITLLTSVMLSRAQEQDSASPMDRRIKEILASGVDSLIYYGSDRTMGFIPDWSHDTCLEIETEILLWRYKRATYFQRFGFCDVKGETKSLTSSPTIIRSAAFEILSKHYKEIEFEQIVPGVFKWNKAGMDVYQQLRSDHPKMFELRIYINGNSQSTVFDAFSLMDSVTISKT